VKTGLYVVGVALLGISMLTGCAGQPAQKTSTEENGPGPNGWKSVAEIDERVSIFLKCDGTTALYLPVNTYTGESTVITQVPLSTECIR